MRIACFLHKGTARVREQGAPETEDKDAPQDLVSFSVIRPTSLNVNAILRLEAKGIAMEVFQQAQTRQRSIALLRDEHVSFGFAVSLCGMSI